MPNKQTTRDEMLDRAKEWLAENCSPRRIKQYDAPRLADFATQECAVLDSDRANLQDAVVALTGKVQSLEAENAELRKESKGLENIAANRYPGTVTLKKSLNKVVKKNQSLTAALKDANDALEHYRMLIDPRGTPRPDEIRQIPVHRK